MMMEGYESDILGQEGGVVHLQALLARSDAYQILEVDHVLLSPTAYCGRVPPYGSSS